MSIADYQDVSIMGDEGGPTRAEENWREAEFETGIEYIAPWEDPYGGFPKHARRCARSLDNFELTLDHKRWPVKLRSFDPKSQWRMHFEVGGQDKVDLRKKYDDLLTRTLKAPAVQVYQVVPIDSSIRQIVSHAYMDPSHLAVVNQFRVISCVFERDRISSEMANWLNQVGQVWVASVADQVMLHQHGVKRVRVVPIPYFEDDPLVALRGRERLPGPVRFYHIGKWEPRKAHHEMVGAFLHAFEPGQAKLYLKTSGTAPDFQGYPKGPEQSVHLWCQDEVLKKKGWTVEKVNQNVHFIRRRLSDEEIRKLHAMGDIYLSLSRGEGFDMPAYDAKIAGNLMVYTPSGGPQDFAHYTDVRVKTSGHCPCHSWYGWGEGAQYLDWKMEDAVEGLQTAWRYIKQGYPRGHVDDRFLSHHVAQKMSQYVREVAEAGSAFAEEMRRRAEAEADA